MLAALAAVALLLAGVLSRAEAAGDPVLTGFETRLVPNGFEADFRFAGTPRSRMMVLTGPNRVAIDFYDTVSAVKDLRIDANRMVAGLRQGLISNDRFRLVIELARPGIPELVTKTDGDKSTTTLRIVETDARTFRTSALSIGSETPVETGSIAAPAAEPKSYTVVIDAGHGGIDTGAIGKHGTQEKEVNLKFALALRDRLAADPRIHVVLTRDDDTYIPLGERSAIAQRAKANLFVSMHSDSIRYAALRGATVYTLSEKASDSLAREIADSENSADRFVDPQWREGAPEVFDILVELTRRETGDLSEHFAAGLVQELGRHDIRLIGNPKRSAGFRVLTAPDVPSVLLELGYLSNVDDEQLLLDESWRRDSAAAIASAISRFLGVEPVASAEPEK
ncbi:N-acetylmuramoyl-L-alanine amidase [Aureimonas leprariae]|uniref:N-acetylmuramoyl-L-alanine amidase n=2 Tax=Plantimonas leprariae TaxID=2615207 RepID=A0A7V7TY85_9HYPH|nr:N-acetylmuramoyl-L-alanine amidase [Aureimonas leprariae]